MLLAWVSANNITSTAQSSLVRVTKTHGTGKIGPSNHRKALDYIPWNGSIWFWYRNRLVSYRTDLIEFGSHREEKVSLTCLGKSSRLLKALMAECREEYLSQAKSKIAIFEHRAERWRKTGAKNIRPLSTVILSDKEKEPLVDDVKQFLEPQTRAWYSQRSLPYRRGYLLSGPPGTGKSSLSFSIAGEFDLDIYIVSIPNTTDRNLKDLFDMLPDKCMVLLEDIDAVGMPRSAAESDDIGDDKALLRRKSPVTLSGLLNTLDGVSSQEGRIVMMTTNHVDKIDEALIRPGRVDLKVEIELVNKDVMAQIFLYIYGHSDGGKDSAIDMADVADQAARFAASLPESTFSQAEIISYLLQYRDRPDGALQNCHVWADAILQTKTSLKRGNNGTNVVKMRACRML